jgi:flavin reductase (DIM6/NTAB) family NADH-FMN oxidoreductase RutF
MSRAPILAALPEELVRHLEGGQLNVVSSIDTDGRPSTTLMSWVVAISPGVLALCVDTRSRTFLNVQERPVVAIEVLGDGITWGVKGRVRVAKERMESTPFPCALIEVLVDEARDHGSPGTQFHGPRYSYDDDKQHRHGLEEKIFAELRAPRG